MHPIEHFCCRNSVCADYGKRGLGNMKFQGYSGHTKQIRMVFCRTCKRYFSERAGTVLEQARLPKDKIAALLEHTREGCGVRRTSRLTGVATNTVMRYVHLAGRHAQQLHDELVAFSPADQGSAV